MLFSWNIHPCLLPQSLKDCSINLCLFFCSASWKDAQHHSLSEKCKSKPQWGTITLQSGWLLSKSLLFFLKCLLYYEYSSVVTKDHSSWDEQSLATLQYRIQPNYLLLGKDTFHPHKGTMSSKTNLFPHSQNYSNLSLAPVSTWDDPTSQNMTDTLPQSNQSNPLLRESYMPIWRVCPFSTRQQETKNI